MAWKTNRILGIEMSGEQFLDGKVTLYNGDSRDVLKSIPDNSIDSVVTDPPYALVSIVKRFGGENSAPAKDGDVYARASAGFMGKQWDTGETAFAVEFWAEVMRVLKPGGHVVAASGTRTYHRLAVAIEDAGFEIRDQILWLYGSGFPKSHDVSKGIDRAAGAVREVVGTRVSDGGRSGGNNKFSDALNQARIVDITAPATPEAAQWQGWGTALKPACEPWVLARKPLIEKTVAANVLEYGTGAINIDGCRVEHGDDVDMSAVQRQQSDPVSGFKMAASKHGAEVAMYKPGGRFPANVIHDGSDEVLAGFPERDGAVGMRQHGSGTNSVYGDFSRSEMSTGHGVTKDSGSAARFFYSAKADSLDRIGSKHPTVKPVDLKQYLCRLVTPPGGTILDPFAGSGTTGEAAWLEGFQCVLIEREADYAEDIRDRLRLADQGVATKKRAIAKKKHGDKPIGGLFA